jgi:hypothetical protein
MRRTVDCNCADPAPPAIEANRFSMAASPPRSTLTHWPRAKAAAPGSWALARSMSCTTRAASDGDRP